MKILVDENIPLKTVKETHYGLLIIRLKQPNRSKIHQKVIKGLALYPEKEWIFKTVVMQDWFHSSWDRKRPKPDNLV